MVRTHTYTHHTHTHTLKHTWCSMRMCSYTHGWVWREISHVWYQYYIYFATLLRGLRCSKEFLSWKFLWFIFFFLVFSYSLAFVTANAECCLHLGKALQTLETHRKVVATRDSNSLCDKVWCAVFYEYNIVTETKQIRFYWNVGKNVIYIHMKSPQKHLRNCRTWQQIKIFWLTSILWQSHRDNSLYFHKILKDTLCSLGKSINLRMVIFTLMKWF